MESSQAPIALEPSTPVLETGRTTNLFEPLTLDAIIAALDTADAIRDELLRRIKPVGPFTEHDALVTFTLSNVPHGTVAAFAGEWHSYRSTEYAMVSTWKVIKHKRAEVSLHCGMNCVADHSNG